VAACGWYSSWISALRGPEAGKEAHAESHTPVLIANNRAADWNERLLRE